MKEIAQVTYLKVSDEEIKVFRDFLEIIEENGFDSDAIYESMASIANAEKFAYCADGSPIAKIEYEDEDAEYGKA